MNIDIYSLSIWVYYILISLLIFSILLDNRNPAKTAAYILILVFMPIIGVVIYMLFGQDYKKRKLFNLKGYNDNLSIKRWEKENTEKIKLSEENESDEISKVLRSGSSLVTTNNHVTVLKNGEAKFKELFIDLEKATHHIHLEYYIIESDSLTQRIGEILIAKAKAGVIVRVVFDDVGSRGLTNKTIKLWKSSGIQVEQYMKVRFPYFTSKANYRDHRKIAIIDGTIGYLGGINISNRYVNQPNQKDIWRDTHLKFKGESVRQLQLQFMLMWKFVKQEMIPVTVSYFPGLPTYPHLATQIIVSGPDSDYPNIMLSFFKHIVNAKKTVYLTTPYFIPNDQISTAIISAALSGVDVKLIIPKHADSKIVQAASMSYLKELLKAGVRVFLYDKGFIHAKTLIVDHEICSVGTANLDVRSFNINFEVNAFMFDPDVSAQLEDHFEEDLRNSEELFLKRWERRPLTKRLIESTARLLAPVL